MSEQSGAPANERVSRAISIANTVVDGRHTRIGEALDMLRGACRTYPDSFHAFYHLGNTLNFMRRWAEAEGPLRTALLLDPHSIEARYDLALCVTGQRKFTEGIELLRAVTAARPDHPAAWFWLGHYLLAAGLAADALHALEQAAQRDTSPRVFHHLTLANIMTGRFDGAADSYRRMKGGVAGSPEAVLIAIFNMYTYWRGLRGDKTFSLNWLGRECQKMPADMWVYQEIVHETRPDLLIECGTYAGGSALYFASLFDLLDNGRIISVDIDAAPDLPVHRRITYLRGSSVGPDPLRRISDEAAKAERVMVILDSDHSRHHVRRELDLYSPLVTSGCYLVVEDTNIGFNPAWNTHYDEGPAAAVAEFLAQSSNFEVDPVRERFLLTVCPGGFLRRK